MDTGDRLLLGLVASVGLIIGITVVSPKPPEVVAAAEAAKISLPAGATLIYQNDHNSNPKRVLRIENCYVTEAWDGAAWYLMNDDGFVAVSCVP
jgi:hypothetical protein